MSFSLQIDNFVNETLQAIDNTLQELVIKIGDSLVYLTPVLTGRLRGNWQLTLGAPSNQSLVKIGRAHV